MKFNWYIEDPEGSRISQRHSFEIDPEDITEEYGTIDAADDAASDWAHSVVWQHYRLRTKRVKDSEDA